MSKVATFEVHYTRFLDEDGTLTGSPPKALADPASLIPIYQLMSRARAFDTRAISLQRTGQLGTYASCLGQEAVGAAVAHVMRPEDVFLPTYRELAAQMGRGVSLMELLLYWGGDERGSNFAVAREDFPVCIPIATQYCHAVGVASAFKYRGEARVAVVAGGDGSTSRGDFYESMNYAGVADLPVVFVVSNNQWAISVPRTEQSAAATLAQKAVAAGIEGVQVDGNDVIALLWVLTEALAKARDGRGPTLIEALTYRLESHTTADDASRYRNAEEVEAQRERGPLRRTRKYLEAAGVWSEEEEQRLAAKLEDELSRAIEAYRAIPGEPAESIFDNLYAELPAALVPQRDSLAQEEQADG